MDDIDIFSPTFDENLARLTKVFSRLKQGNLKLKPSKCFLFRDEIAHLGHRVSKGGALL